MKTLRELTEKLDIRLLERLREYEWTIYLVRFVRPPLYQLNKFNKTVAVITIEQVRNMTKRVFIEANLIQMILMPRKFEPAYQWQYRNYRFY